MIKDFDKKLDKLPEEVRNILLSETGVKLEKFLVKKYLISSETKTVGDLLCLIYFKDISLVGALDFFNKNYRSKNNEENKFLADLVGMRVLPAKEYFKDEDFEYIIHNLGGDIEKYEKFIKFSKDAVIKEERGEETDIAEILGIKKEKEVNEIEDDKKIVNLDLDAKKEKNDSIKIFKNSIKHLLVEGNKNILEDYNLVLLELVVDDPKFRRDLENSLYNNEEKLSTSKFRIKGVEKRPTIGNWLKDFIKRNGTKMFSDVVLMEYLTKSENTKNLYTNERVLLSKLLQLYRNLKFFPESQKGLREEDWEIIPVQEIKESRVLEKKKVGIPKTTAEKNIEKLEDDAKGFKDGSLEKLAVQEEIEHEKKIEELRFMATKFGEGSLEKKAIEEELKKLEHAK